MDNTPLHLACERGQTQAVIFLLESGFSLHTKNKVLILVVMTSIMIACVCTNILHIYKPERSVSLANPQTFRKNNYCTVLIEDYIRTSLIGTDTYNYSVFSVTIVPLYIEDYIRTSLVSVMIHICLYTSVGQLVHCN